MAVRNLTPAVGWFAMMKCEDAPEHVNPVRIACFAISESDHVVAMIPCTETATLTQVTDDECIGFAFEDDIGHPSWNDIAKHRLQVELEEEDRKQAKDSGVIGKKIEKLTDNDPTIVRELVSLLTAMKKQEPYLYDPKKLHPLYEENVIDTFEGGYKLTHIGEAFLLVLITKLARPS